MLVAVNTDVMTLIAVVVGPDVRVLAMTSLQRHLNPSRLQWESD